MGFRRLAVLELSAAGDQPMLSACGRYVLVFNGEIYNSSELRNDLDPYVTTPWNGQSDTETLLAALACWGVRKTLANLDGMFAFVLWDRNTRTLSFARDRFGEKPLCFGWQNGVFLFGSTLAAIRPHPAYCPDICAEATAAFFSSGFVPAPLTIQQGISKLRPGQFGEMVFEGTPKPEVKLHSYFDAHAVATQHHDANGKLSFDEAVDKLDVLIAQSVETRMHADVPVGLFLSGGIDSSLVTAHAAHKAGSRVSTFTISFPDSENDEAPFARGIARHLGTDHHEMPVTDRDARDVVPTINESYDEPFADPSAVPSIVLSAKTRDFVTVALSGDGGDELFGGYPRYTAAAHNWTNARKTPALLRPIARQLAGLNGIPGRKNFARIGLETLADAYTPYVSRWSHTFPMTCQRPRPSWPSSSLAPEEQFMLADTQHYLPEGLQAKMDRASMSSSLEVRAPLLNEKIAAFAWGLPLEYRIHPQHGGKYILRRTLGLHVPNQLFERPKAGFYQPLPAWLRGDLRDWAESLLTPEALEQSNLIKVGVVRKAWRDHLNGRNRALDLWTALMFQQWLQSHS